MADAVGGVAAAAVRNAAGSACGGLAAKRECIGAASCEAVVEPVTDIVSSSLARGRIRRHPLFGALCHQAGPHLSTGAGPGSSHHCNRRMHLPGQHRRCCIRPGPSCTPVPGPVQAPQHWQAQGEAVWGWVQTRGLAPQEPGRQPEGRERSMPPAVQVSQDLAGCLPLPERTACQGSQPSYSAVAPLTTSFQAGLYRRMALNHVMDEDARYSLHRACKCCHCTDSHLSRLQHRHPPIVDAASAADTSYWTAGTLPWTV